MYHVDWQKVATEPVLQKLRDIAGSGNAPATEQLRPLVGTILGHAGGLPVAKTNWSEAQRTSVCKKLLLEGVGAVLCRKRQHRPTLPGCDLGPGGAGLDRVLQSRDRVAINSASEATLLPLPVLGPTTAGRTVAERQRGGAFHAAKDLDERVKGVTESGARRLALMLDFATSAPATPAFKGDFDTDIATLVAAQPAGNAAERLLAALEEVAVFCAAEPHPATRGTYRRADLPSGSKAKVPARDNVEAVELLEDAAYYDRLQELLSSATTSIDVAMFFIAFPVDTHPSKALLEQLADQHDAGLAVRVLVDRDDEDDPYGSRVINTAAIEFLKGRGVAVRTDTQDNLLHSKFVVLDGDKSVIGSHNWTAGSYFRYHDTSVAITGSDFTASLKSRFETLWSEGDAA